MGFGMVNADRGVDPSIKEVGNSQDWSVISYHNSDHQHPVDLCRNTSTNIITTGRLDHHFLQRLPIILHRYEEG